MSGLRDRIWAWLTAKSLTRLQVILLVGLMFFGPYIPQHPTLEILRWLILALLFFLIVLIGRIAWTQRGRRK